MEAFERSELHTRIDERVEDFINWLLKLASIPSVSATGEGISTCASELASLLRSLGVRTEILDTGGEPLVWGSIGQGSPCLVVYGHYDVQPAGPLDAWQHPPFTPFLKNDAIYGRGVGDNKGQLLAHVSALSAWLDVFGSPPPFRLVFVFDGEEEIGSPASSRFIGNHPEYFSGDFLYGADGDTLGIWNPAIFLGVQGLLYVELSAKGAPREWHSGSYGSLLPNPVLRLTTALLSLIDRDGNVTIDRFYDDVRSPTKPERELLARLPAGFLDDPSSFGIDAFLTPSPRADMFFRPQICICGFYGGHTGDGVKTSVPTDAHAKIDFTLVSDQRPDKIADALRSHLNDEGFHDIELRILAACPPIQTPVAHPFVKLAIRALENVWGKAPTVFPSIGGGGPLAAFAEQHGMPCLMVPYGQADLHQHSPDEHLSVKWFVNGVKTSAELFRLLASEPRQH